MKSENVFAFDNGSRQAESHHDFAYSSRSY